MGHLTRKDWYAALLCMALGAGIVWGSTRYSMGTLARFGPGYYPLLLGVLLLFVGLLLLVAPEAADDADEVDATGVDGVSDVDRGPNARAGRIPASWFDRSRPWVCVVAGMLIFMGVGTYGGFIPATFLLILVSALGDRGNTLKGSLGLAAAATAASVAVFHYGLQMQFPLVSWG